MIQAHNPKRRARRAGVTTARQQRRKRVAAVQARNGTRAEWAARQKADPSLSKPKK